jgi:outer membrane protein assembly factor BamB
MIAPPVCNENNPCSQDACHPEDCDTSSNHSTDSVIYGMDVQWIHDYPPYGGIHNYFAKGDYIFNATSFSTGYTIQCYEKTTGNLIWIFDEPIVDYFSDIHFHQPSNILIAQRSSRIVAIDATTGNLISNYQPTNYSSSATFGELLGDYYYLPVRSLDQQQGFVLRAHVSDLSNWTEVYRIHTDQVGGSRPSINSMNLWTEPASGDQILILQHRMAFPRRIDLVAYNMTADTIFWWLPEIAPEGNSNIKQIDIFNDKVVFCGSHSLHCVDVASGNILWQQKYPFPPSPPPIKDFILSSLALFWTETLCLSYTDVIDNSVGGANDNIMALDLNTGNLKYELVDNSTSILIPTQSVVFNNGSSIIIDGTSGNVLLKDNKDPVESNLFQFDIDKSSNIIYAILRINGDNKLAALQIPPKWQ